MSRPFIWVNCACSVDGRLANIDGTPRALSGENDFRRVHTLRAFLDGILVGKGTIVADDPSLVVKPELIDEAYHERLEEEFPDLSYGSGGNPTRIVLSSTGDIPTTSRVFDRRAPCVLLTETERELGMMGVTTVTCASLSEGLGLLEGAGITSILVEGGSRTIASFLEAGLVDRFTVFISPVLIGGGPPVFDGSSVVGLRLLSMEPLDHGVLLTFSLPEGP